jgi:hypothetical protein
MEGKLLPFTVMSMNDKHGKWNKKKKHLASLNTLEKLRKTADVVKIKKSINLPISSILIKVYFSFIYGFIAYNSQIYLFNY